MNIDELEPGSETDRLVAEAIGVFVEMSSRSLFRNSPAQPERVQIVLVSGKGPNGDRIREFAPSTNLNDAFWAAEKVSTFFYMYHAEFIQGIYECRVSEEDKGEMLEHADTPAMAICK